ncbi:MAG: class B sortase [Eubacterium sp.]|nr:class B sortase [Eubacterium sp.]
MKKKKIIGNIILVLCILVFLGSGYYLFQYFNAARETQSELDELIELKEESLEDTEDTEEIKTEAGKTILKKYKKLYKKNKDMIGWVQVKGTEIDYPVMQTKKDNEYYLHRNFKKEEDVNGLPFLDASCDVEDPNNNLMIYGHHMKSGMMFAHLMDFQEEDFFKKHGRIQVDTLYEEREYEVVAAFYSQIYDEDQDVFKYYQYPGSLSQKKFDTYVKNVKKLSLYDTGVTPEYGDQLVTLVTCAYQTEEGRFVVVGRRTK